MALMRTDRSLTVRDAVKIDGRPIGAGYPCYIIAELSANHNQNFNEAVRLVEAAHDAGADAVKLQTYTADTITLDSDRECFKINNGSVWSGKTLHGLYQEAYTPWDWQPKLKQICEKLGMHCFSSPFDFTAVDFLEKMGVPAYKVASFEIVDIPLLKKIAATQKPVIISTGMAVKDEIHEAVRTVRAAGNDRIVLLKCTSSYPASYESMNLRAIPAIKAEFGCECGLSDHTLDLEVPITAVALGAVVIEKHLTMSRAIPGPDSTFSMEPGEFKRMVESVRRAEKAMGSGQIAPEPGELGNVIFRRSLFVVKDVCKGERFTGENVRSIRPANGLHTRHFDEIVGKTAAEDVKRGTPLEWRHIVKS